MNTKIDIINLIAHKLYYNGFKVFVSPDDPDVDISAERDNVTAFIKYYNKELNRLEVVTVLNKMSDKYKFYYIVAKKGKSCVWYRKSFVCDDIVSGDVDILPIDIIWW